MFTLTCPCLFGLESVLSGEMIRQEFSNIHAENGRVSFSGGFPEMVRANLNLRSAERVQIEIGTFEATTFEELFEGTAALPFETFLGANTAFPVTGYSISSCLHSVPSCQSIIKKAIVKRLQKRYGGDWMPESGETMRIQFGIHKDQVSLYLDTSGAGLHKRGYREQATEAPIKETLAAGMADLLRAYPDTQLYDPLCGSGTLLIEAALKAYNIAPGINRKFQFETWPIVDPIFLKQERERAYDLVDRTASFHGYGYDYDPIAVELTENNAKKAGVGKRITAKVANISKFQIPNGRFLVLTNPPYGERLLDLEQAVTIYRTLGTIFPKQKGARYGIITPYESFESAFDRSADKRRKLYNGSIKCQFYMYFRS